MFEVNNLGVDFNSDYEFKDGDLILIMDSNNLIQSIINRFNTRLDSLNLFYTEYGSNIYGFLGWVKNDDTLEFIELEIRDTLEQDPRCQDFDVTVTYYKGTVVAEVTISFDEETDLTFNLVMSKDGRIDLLNNTNENEEGEE